MKIHELTIEGFKSIGEITLIEPNPFSVFVGPNAAGKSNIFEALEFMELCNATYPIEVLKLFGNITDILNQTPKTNTPSLLKFQAQIDTINSNLRLVFANLNGEIILGSFSGNQPSIFKNEQAERANNDANYKQFTNFTRLFVNNKSIVKQIVQDDFRLASDASNLEKVLKRIFKNEKDKEEIIEILQLLIPGFSNIDIKTEELSGSDNLIIYEEALKKPLTKRLISDGTYNILAIIAAIYQSEEPQFLCIEEPENGLNPKVVSLLVSLFRDKCVEKGHYIWLNTHSQTLVGELTPEEIILVNKVNGQTQTKQIQGMDLHGLRMDEALLTNSLGGGIPW